MPILEISSESRPNKCTSDGERHPRCTVNAFTRPNGDIEITRDNCNDHKVLTVIPKEKRAALAEFLVRAV